MAGVRTPCINVCTLDHETSLCFGCGRSGGEIATWLQMSPDMRDAVMAQLPERRRALDAKILARAAAREARD